jgi:hypothetical protein
MGFASLYPSYAAPARGEKESTHAKPLTGRTVGRVEHLRNPSRHQPLAVMGFASLYPSYDVLLVPQERAVERRDQLARVALS